MCEKEEEIVRIKRDGQVVDVYHDTHKSFIDKGYRKYERPFTAEFGYIEITDIARFTDEKR